MKLNGQDVDIHIAPAELYNFFKKHIDTIGNSMIKIAENTNMETEIYLSAGYLKEPEESLVISVYKSDEMVFSQTAYDQEEATSLLKTVYNVYLFPKDEISEQLLMIEEREAELDDVFADFLSNVFGEDYSMLVALPELESEISELRDEVFIKIASHGFPVYCPLINEGADGSKEFLEYPYNDELDFQLIEETLVNS